MPNVRVVTHRKILRPPSRLEVALGFLAGIAASPSYRPLLADATYGTAFEDAERTAAATGNLAFDAQIAAVCHSHGAVLLTADHDFARFAIPTESLGRA